MQFKRLQISLVECLRECRDTQLELIALINTHIAEVENGVGVEVCNGHIHLLNDVEPRLNRLFKDFFSKARTSLYHLSGQVKNPKSVTHFLLGQSISFVQAKDDAKFEEGAKKFLRDVPGEKALGLMNMLREDRANWCSTLIGTRDRIVHDVDCPQLKINYRVEEERVRAFFPTVNGCELRQFANTCWENLYQSVEETVLLCIAIRMPDYIIPCRIPDDRIDPNLRFRWAFAIRPDRSQRS